MGQEEIKRKIRRKALTWIGTQLPTCRDAVKAMFRSQFLAVMLTKIRSQIIYLNVHLKKPETKEQTN